MPRALDDDEKTRSDPHAFVMRCVAEGVPPEKAQAELERNGIDPEQARWLVDSAYGRGDAAAEPAEPVEPAEPSLPYSSAVLPQAALAGLVAAVVGGLAWTIQVALTDYEVGIVAWALGGLAGFAVASASGRRRGLPLQVLAVVSALLGILFGKFGTYVWTVRDELDNLGLEAPGYLDSIWIENFVEDLDLVFGWFDLLWIGLAVFTAWRMLQPTD